MSQLTYKSSSQKRTANSSTPFSNYTLALIIIAPSISASRSLETSPSNVRPCGSWKPFRRSPMATTNSCSTLATSNMQQRMTLYSISAMIVSIIHLTKAMRNSWSLARPNANTTLSKYMRDWYSSYVIFSDPNRQSWLESSFRKKPIWPMYGVERSSMVVNDTGIGVQRDDDSPNKCNFWRRNSAVVRNRVVEAALRFDWHY
jgi:hypothetical protein